MYVEGHETASRLEVSARGPRHAFFRSHYLQPHFLQPHFLQPHSFQPHRKHSRMHDYTNTTALVTGASKGLGEAYAR
ncbi:hypothetical protein KE639_06266 [Streptomyces sp. V17-9]|nr:hypothetical protein KE639_06266 [Streptomyces sp. V17-9]